jgi:heme exporter protein CcmB
MTFLRHAAMIAWKDLRVELRTREILYMMLFFAAVVVLIFSFAFVAPSDEGASGTVQVTTGGAIASLEGARGPVRREVLPNVAAGVLWIAVIFAGTLGLGRAFDREREHDTMRALLLSPVDRGAVFLGKALGIATFMLMVEALVVPLIAILLNAPIDRRPGELALLLLLVTIGFATVGSVFAATLMRSRAREVLLAVMLYPVIIPALIAGAKGTSAIWMDPPELGVAHFWIKFMLVFDAIFIMVALWAFESLVVE